MARKLVDRALDLHVVGLEHVPSAGPAILVARHYHHLYDAAAILARVPREVHVLVALDWLRDGASAADDLARSRGALARRVALRTTLATQPRRLLFEPSVTA